MFRPIRHLVKSWRWPCLDGSVTRNIGPDKSLNYLLVLDWTAVYDCSIIAAISLCHFDLGLFPCLPDFTVQNRKCQLTAMGETQSDGWKRNTRNGAGKNGLNEHQNGPVIRMQRCESGPSLVGTVESVLVSWLKCLRGIVRRGLKGYVGTL